MRKGEEDTQEETKRQREREREEQIAGRTKEDIIKS